MSNPESVIQNEILLALGRLPYVRAWRSNVGLFYTDDGRPIRAGVPGAADITGILDPGGVRLEIEVKTLTGRQSEQQKAYERMIRDRGGIYVLARSVAEAIAAVEAEHGRRVNGAA